MIPDENSYVGPLSLGAELTRFSDGRCAIIAVYPGNGRSAGDVEVPPGSFLVEVDGVPVASVVDANCNWIGPKRPNVPMAWKIADGDGNDLGICFPAWEPVIDAESDEIAAISSDESGVAPTAHTLSDLVDASYPGGRPSQSADAANAVAPDASCEVVAADEADAPMRDGRDTLSSAEDFSPLPIFKLLEQRSPQDRRPFFISSERSQFEREMVASAARSAEPQSAINSGYRPYRID